MKCSKYSNQSRKFFKIASKLPYTNKIVINSSDENIVSKYLFCLIKTTPNALKSNKALTTYKIWGSRCSNYRFVALIPDELLNKSVKYGEHREIAEPYYILQPEDIKVYI